MAAAQSPQRITRLLALTDALACIEDRVSAIAPQAVPAAEAGGRTLAVDIIAADLRPSAAVALRDGWAVRSEETLDAGSYGAAKLSAHLAVEVGDLLPAFADAVSPSDGVSVRATDAEAVITVAPGEGLLPPGGDHAPSQRLLAAGQPLSRTDLALLRIVGKDEVSVREPRVAIIPARHGDGILDTIATLVGEMIAADGGIALPRGEGEDLDSLLSGAKADAMIVVGGSGMGARDRSIATLARLGELVFHGVGLAPGETTAFGMIGDRPVLIVPGRLDAALAAWLMLGRALLARLSARRSDDLTSVGAWAGTWVGPLARKITSTVGMTDIVLVRRDNNKVVPLASGYLSLLALAQADGWLAVPADWEGIPADTKVAVRPLP
jgi:molybdopterin molybdotransferase